MALLSFARPARAWAVTPALLAVLVLVSLSTPAPLAAAEEPRREVPYKVELVGELPAVLRTLITSVSLLETEAKSPPLSGMGLRRRVRTDLDRIDAVLRSEGYYASSVIENIDLTSAPATVRIEIATGPRYVIADIAVHLIDERPTPHAVALLRTLERPAEASPARSQLVSGLAANALRVFIDQGYLAAKLGEREFRVDHATRTLSGDIELMAGARVSFGAVRFEGLSGVNEDYALSLVSWREGDYVSREDVDKTSKALLATRLFDTVRIDRKPPLAGDDISPLVIAVTERPFRSIGFGFAYDSEDGVTANTYWEHRNLGGAGRRLRLSLHGGLQEIGGNASYRQPNFFSPEQAFLADAALLTEDTKAYDADRATAAVGLERLLGAHTVGRLGLALDNANVEAKALEDGTNGSENLTFISLPLVVRYDDSDELLAPTRGLRLDLQSTPFWELFGADASFSKNELTLRGYRLLDAKQRWVGALRASAGTIIGAGRSEIPVDKRFFSGGGGSVRGYEHQFAGPLGPDRNDPTRLRPLGGRSFAELGGELRLRIGESFGLVAFVDGGSAYESVLPDAKHDFFVGAGLGGRYYTAIGPIRVDVATPVNGRDTDDPVQVYISIGESY